MTKQQAILTLALGLGMGCGAIENEGVEPPTSTSQAITVPAAARLQVQAICKGAYSNAGRCVSCVARAAESLRKNGTISGAQKGQIIASFANGECRAKCVPTACAIEADSCGALPDLCGHMLACGGCPSGQSCTNNICVSTSGGPNLQRCFCVDGSVLNVCAQVDCDSGLDQDRICGPLCATRGGEAGTGCFFSDPSCASP